MLNYVLSWQILTSYFKLQHEEIDFEVEKESIATLCSEILRTPFQIKSWYYNFTKNLKCDIHLLVTKKNKLQQLQEQQSYLTEVESAIH